MTTLSTITGVIVTLGSQKSVVFQLKNVREKGIKIEENDLSLFFRLGKCVRSYNLQR